MKLLKDFKLQKDQMLQDEKFREICKKHNVLHLSLDRFRRCRRFQEKIFFRLNDIPVTERLTKKLFRENSIWFVMNCEVINDNIIPVPLGITDTSWCKVIGNLDVIEETNKTERNYRNLAYFNCNCDRKDAGLKERLEVIKNFGREKWLTVGKFERNHSGHRRFIEEIYNHKFVFCPRGNGVDTHRLWMTLYLGSIPIVKDHITHRTFKHLPILFVKDWNEISEEFLKEKYEEIHSKEYDFSILKMEYWEKLFGEKFS